MYNWVKQLANLDSTWCKGAISGSNLKLYPLKTKNTNMIDITILCIDCKVFERFLKQKEQTDKALHIREIKNNIRVKYKVGGEVEGECGKKQIKNGETPSPCIHIHTRPYIHKEECLHHHMSKEIYHHMPGWKHYIVCSNGKFYSPMCKIIQTPSKHPIIHYHIDRTNKKIQPYTILLDCIAILYNPQ